MAEDITGLPLIMQGSGSAPDTVGGMQMVNNNASTVLRRIARNDTIASLNRTFDVITGTS